MSRSGLEAAWLREDSRAVRHFRRAASHRPALLSVAAAPGWEMFRLVSCLANSWCFVAPTTPWCEARRWTISAGSCECVVTEPQALFDASLRAAALLS